MSAEFPRASFWRRFASLVYDTLAIIAFAMLSVVLYLFAVQGLISLEVISLNGAEDVAIFGLRVAKRLVCAHGV